MMTSEKISFGVAPPRIKTKDEKVVVFTDRVRKLTEELIEKKAHFQQISKGYFSVYQDYQTKSTYRKELKSKAASKLKDKRLHYSQEV